MTDDNGLSYYGLTANDALGKIICLVIPTATLGWSAKKHIHLQVTDKKFHFQFFNGIYHNVN